MNKILGRNKEEIIKRYGEPDGEIDGSTVLIYKKAFEVTVNIKFDENFVARKVYIEDLNESSVKKEEQVTSTLQYDKYFLDDFETAQSKLMGMTLSDVLILLGKPQGYIESVDTRVFFDSNKNCIFVKFNNLLVTEVFKMNYLDAMQSGEWNRYANLTLLMNEFIGCEKTMIHKTYDVYSSGTKARRYGYSDITWEIVYITYNAEGIAELIELR